MPGSQLTRLPGSSMSVDSGRTVGRLVHLEPDPVAEAVPELLAPAGLLDHAARRPVGVGAAHARSDRLEPRELRRQADLVRTRQLVRQLARGVRARAVRRVAADLAARRRR